MYPKPNNSKLRGLVSKYADICIIADVFTNDSAIETDWTTRQNVYNFVDDIF